MNIELDPTQVRVIGCLMEKSVTTPDQYPLSLNALVNACNQKSSRDPVMSLDAGTVQHAVRQLGEQRLIATDEKGRVERYTQRFCNTPFADLQFTPEQFAVVTVLMLRGDQTPGELRTRSNRMFEFADNAEIAATLETLINREEGAVVARLPRQAGRQDHTYAHLFAGAIESVDAEVAPSRGSGPAQPSRLQMLEERVQTLEAEVARLATLIAPEGRRVPAAEHEPPQE